MWGALALLALAAVAFAADPAFDRRICYLRPDAGTPDPACRLTTRLFYFDVAARTCGTFVFRGCSPSANANRFQTWEECTTACAGGSSAPNSFLSANPLNPFAQPAAQTPTPAPAVLPAGGGGNGTSGQIQSIFTQKKYFESVYADGLRRYEDIMSQYFNNVGSVKTAPAQPQTPQQLPIGQGAAKKLVGDDATFSCGDLVLNAVLSRRQTERYSHEYSSTVAGSRHPAGSTVQLKCTENAIPANTYAYDAGNELVASGTELTAVCDAKAQAWLLEGRAFKKVYCSRVAAKTSEASAVSTPSGCRDILLYQRFSIQTLEKYDYKYSEPAEGGVHPDGSSVDVSCTENGVDGLLYVYATDSEFIQRSSVLSAVCNGTADGSAGSWSVDGKDVAQAYCSTRGLNETESEDDDACVHFNPALFPSRRGFEFYDFKYSETEGNRWHPANSSVFIRCTTGGITGVVAAFDVNNVKVEVNDVQIATCDGAARQWKIGSTETPFARVFCQGSIGSLSQGPNYVLTSPGSFGGFQRSNTNSLSSSLGLGSLGRSSAFGAGAFGSANAFGGANNFGGRQGSGTGFGFGGGNRLGRPGAWSSRGGFGGGRSTGNSFGNSFGRGNGLFGK